MRNPVAIVPMAIPIRMPRIPPVTGTLSNQDRASVISDDSIHGREVIHTSVMTTVNRNINELADGRRYSILINPTTRMTVMIASRLISTGS